MFLTKRETVTLAQVLAIHAERSDGTSDFQRATDALRKRAEDSLSDLGEDPCVSGECHDSCEAQQEVDDDEDDNEEADDDECKAEDAAGEEDEAECTVAGEGLRSDLNVTVGQLLRLPFVTTHLGKARFNSDGDQVNLTCTGLGGWDWDVEDVTHLKRFAKALHVCDGEGEWHVLNVAKWPKLWTARLPTKKLVEVVQ